MNAESSLQLNREKIRRNGTRRRFATFSEDRAAEGRGVLPEGNGDDVLETTEKAAFGFRSNNTKSCI